MELLPKFAAPINAFLRASRMSAKERESSLGLALASWLKSHRVKISSQIAVRVAMRRRAARCGSPPKYSLTISCSTVTSSPATSGPAAKDRSTKIHMGSLLNEPFRSPSQIHFLASRRLSQIGSPWRGGERRAHGPGLKPPGLYRHRAAPHPGQRACADPQPEVHPLWPTATNEGRHNSRRAVADTPAGASRRRDDAA